MGAWVRNCKSASNITSGVTKGAADLVQNLLAVVHSTTTRTIKIQQEH